jgi:nucleotide-binding universal stress UspA family protein
VFKKILLPTDGAPLSAAVARAGVAFASEVGAEIIGIFVAPGYHYPVYVDIVPPNYPSEEEYLASLRTTGQNYLQEIQQAAAEAGVKYSGITVFSNSAAQEIVKAAEESGCDLIFMGSHGRSGWGKLLLGSASSRVLSMSCIPVLVYRPKQDAAAA